MIGALSARALSDVGSRDLASAWGGPGLLTTPMRGLRPGAGAVLQPGRARTRM
jgi:hypothetical protein